MQIRTRSNFAYRAGRFLAFFLASLLALASLHANTLFGQSASRVSSGTSQPPASESQKILEKIRDAKRIVFLGDSITYAGESQVYFDLWVQEQFPDTEKWVINVGLPSETVSGLSEEGHAGGAFPRPDVAERLQRVLDTTQPDLVFACYGMNCGIYLPFQTERFERYQRGIQALHQTISQHATCILITPPLFDDRVVKKDFSYNQVLDRYSQWLVEQRSQGWLVLDLHHAMDDAVQQLRRSNPSLILQPDAVHPNEEGHWVIAKCLLQELGDKRANSWNSPADFFTQMQVDPSLVPLYRQRMQLRRDAYLSAAKHLRPGIAAGLSLDAMHTQDLELSEKIRRAAKIAEPSKP